MFLHLSVSHTEMYMCGMSLYSEDRGEKKKEASTDMMSMTSKSTDTVHCGAVFSLPRSGLTLVCTNAEEIFCDKP